MVEGQRGQCLLKRTSVQVIAATRELHLRKRRDKPVRPTTAATGAEGTEGSDLVPLDRPVLAEGVIALPHAEEAVRRGSCTAPAPR